MVRTPDPRFFEQAIFFLREDVFHREGVTDEQVLSEARQVAAGSRFIAYGIDSVFLWQGAERPGVEN